MMNTETTHQNPIPPLRSNHPESSSPQPAYSQQTQMAASNQLEQNSPNPMFNPVAHSQAGMPHLIDYLKTQYRAHIQWMNETRAQQGQALGDPEATIRAAQPVLDFFESFLNTHRPIQIFPIDMNYGIVLDNNDRVALCPGAKNIQGSMQDSGAISITENLTHPGQDGVVGI